MATNRVTINVDVDSNNAEKNVKELRNQLGQIGDGASKSDKQSNALLGTLKKMAIVLGSVFAVGKIIDFGKSLVEASAGAEALSAQFEQVFGTMQGDATKLINSLGKDFGMLPTRLKEPLTRMTSMFKGLGADTKEAMNMAGQAVTLVADAAAFYDISFEAANSALNSFIKGNYEGGEAIGLFANETQLAAWAMQNGLIGTTKEWAKLGELDKQTARLEFAKAMQESAGATGQATRESEGYENVLGNLKQAWHDLKVLLGAPILEPVIWAMQQLIGIMQTFDVTPITTAMEWLKTAIVDGFNMAKDAVSGFVQSNSDTFSGIKTILQEFATFYIDTIKSSFESVLSFWKENGKSIMDTASSVFKGVVEVVEKSLGVIVPFAQSIMKKMVDFWKSDGKQIMDATKNIFEFIKKTVDFFMPAVQVVVKFVWDAIVNVITGAVDIIQGLIKVLSGLFTGDFSKMWEGVKQLFSGAIDFILGLMSLSFVGGIRTILVNLSKAGVQIIKSLWDDIAKFFTSGSTSATNIASKMVSSVVNFFKNLGSQGTNIINSLKNSIVNGFNAIKDGAVRAVQSMVTGVVNFVTNMRQSFVNIITTMKTQVINKIVEIKNGILNTIKTVDLTQVGKDIVQGLANGIKAMGAKAIESITGVVDGVINKAKSLLGIKSPSRVFASIGEDTIAGMPVGMAKMEGSVQQKLTDINNTMLDVMEHFVDEEKKITQKAKVDIEKIEEAAEAKIMKIKDAARKKKRALTTAEKAEIYKIEEEAAQKSLAIQQKATYDIISLIEKEQKMKLDEVKMFIDNKKSLDQLSAIDEVAIWQDSLKQFQDHTKEKIEAQKAYQKALEVVNKHVMDTNNKYLSEVSKINEDLKKSEQDLTKQYTDALDARTKSLLSFSDTFSEFSLNVENTGEDLLHNLATQVDGFKEWQRQIDVLSEKAIDKGLLEELRAMGVKALPQLVALNQLTDDQLTQYNKLYREKSKLAREQAEAELVGMKSDTDKQITDLRKVAQTQLNKLNIEWKIEISKITKATNDELLSLKTIGKNAIEGLMAGMKQMQPQLQRQAEQMAQSIKASLQNALKIKSPSRWMRDFIVGNMTKGFEIGVDRDLGAYEDSADKIASALMPDVSNIVSGAKQLGKSTLTKMVKVEEGTATKRTVGVDTQGNNYNPTFNNYFTPKESTPYESARKQRQEQQRFGVEWGLI